MLQAISDRAQGLFASIIIGLLIIPFALWGVQQYFGFGKESIFAEINGVEIPQYEFQRRFQMERQRMQSMFKQASLPPAFNEEFIKRNVTTSLVNEEVLYQEVYDAGLRASDLQLRTQIQSTPAFQADGKFSVQAYEEQLRYTGLNPASFEQMLRRSIPMQQYQLGITETAIVTQRNVKDKVRLQEQQREISFVTIPADRFEDGIEIIDQQVSEYYEQHKASFSTPETVSVEYVELDGKKMREAIAVDDDLLEQRYQAQVEAGGFTQLGSRNASHILIEFAEDADQAAIDVIQEQLTQLRQRVQDGEDFASLAKEFSQDKGSAEQGGLVGDVKRGDMVKPFEDALFALQEGELSDPVKTRFGMHLIKLHSVVPDAVKPFDEVRDQLTLEYKDEQMENLFYDQSQILTDLSYETPDSLLPVTQALGLEIQLLERLPRTGQSGEGIGANPKIASSAFSQDVLETGNNSETIEVAPEQLVVLRVKEHYPSVPKPLEEVEEEIKKQLTLNKAREAAQALADKIRQDIDAGELLDLIAQANELTAESLGMVKRNNQKADAEILKNAFTLTRPAEGEKSTGLVSIGNDYAIVQLSKVEDGSIEENEQNAANDAEKPADKPALILNTQRELMKQVGSTQFQVSIESIKSRADIQISTEDP